MGFGDFHGRARVDARRPRGQAVCDRCSQWWNRADLRKQYEYSGTRLFFTGFLVCPPCYDTPQPQNLTPLLPGDPKPLINPRPEYFDVIRGQDGFALYTIWVPDVATVRSESQQAQTKNNLLNQVAALSGAPRPLGFNDLSGVLARPLTTTQIVAANGARSWMLVFNPTAMPLVISTGNAAFAGDPFAVLLGAGCAALTTTAPQQATGGADDERGGLPTLYQGALTAVGLFPNQPYWLFDFPFTGQALLSDAGDPLYGDYGEALLAG